MRAPAFLHRLGERAELARARTGRRLGSIGNRALAVAIASPGRVLVAATTLAVCGWIAGSQTSVVSDIRQLAPSSLPALRGRQLAPGRDRGLGRARRHRSLRRHHRPCGDRLDAQLQATGARAPRLPAAGSRSCRRRHLPGGLAHRPLRRHGRQPDLRDAARRPAQLDPALLLAGRDQPRRLRQRRRRHRQHRLRHPVQPLDRPAGADRRHPRPRSMPAGVGNAAARDRCRARRPAGARGRIGQPDLSRSRYWLPLAGLARRGAGAAARLPLAAAGRSCR